MLSPRKIIIALLYLARDWRSKAMFEALRKYGGRRVLDLGGGDFYSRIGAWYPKPQVWVNLDWSPLLSTGRDSSSYFPVVGEVNTPPFRSESFDSILCIQVLEHIYRPDLVVKEAYRLLQPGGILILLTPQTSNLHLAPNHFYNFTRFWHARCLAEAGFRVIEYRPLGGAWSSIASRQLLSLLQMFRFKGMTCDDLKRSWLFYILSPLMIAYSLITIPICLLFGLADLSEEPNNHLYIAEKL